MTEILCNRCGKPNGLQQPENELAAKLTQFVLCDPCIDDLDAEMAELQAADRDRVHQARVIETLPSGLRHIRFSTSPLPRESQRAAIEWSREGGHLMLTGPVGVGKTCLMAAAVWTRLYAKPIRWISVPNLLSNLNAAFDDDSRAKALSILRGNTSLALDDIDKFKPTEWAASQLFAAIDNTLTNNRDLIVTSNKTPGQLAAHIGGTTGEAIASRLASMQVVQITGQDLRLTA